MIEAFTEFDLAEYLSTPEAIAEFIRYAQETGDANYLAKAMEVATRAKGMTELSRE
jgi:probable addiction module antidote protein